MARQKVPRVRALHRSSATLGRYDGLGMIRPETRVVIVIVATALAVSFVFAATPSLVYWLTGWDGLLVLQAHVIFVFRTIFDVPPERS